MKLIKRITLILVIFVAIATGVAFILPSHMSIEQTVLMNAEPDMIYEQISNLKNWSAWDPWKQDELNMKTTYSGPESGVGAQFDFESENSGKGWLKVNEANAEKGIKFDMHFEKGNMNARGEFRIEKTPQGTKVSWLYESDPTYNPIARYLMTLYAPTMRKTFERGLNNIKTIVEKCGGNHTKIKEGRSTAAILAGFRMKMATPEISKLMGDMYGKIGEYISKKGAKMIGAPGGMYYSYSKDSCDLEAIVPIDKMVPSTKEISVRQMPEMKVVTTIHKGDYRKLEATYNDVKNWIDGKKLKISGPSWEVYLTDPGSPEMAKDTSRWQTQIYFPVE